MKFFITIILATLCYRANAQLEKIPVVNGFYEYTGVTQLDTSLKKADIYKAAKVYFVDNFNSANDVLQYQDPIEGKIIGKGHFDLHETKWLTNILWQVYFTTSIECKDGRYRYRIYDIKIKEDWYGTQNSIKKDLNIDEAIAETQKGQLKKQAASMFNLMAKKLAMSPDEIKVYIQKSSAIAKTEF